MGYELVRVGLTGPGRSTLQVMVERCDRAGMTVDDCALVSRRVSDILDVADPIAAAFTLEVSSPGLDRPLTAPEHYGRFRGLEARIELATPIDGRRRYTGRIVDIDDAGGTATVVLAIPAGEVRLPFGAIRKGKLVMNDDLLAAAERWAEAGRSP